jgi:hypothetical protein
MADSYAWEKLFTAVLILAGGSGSLRERLADAYTSSLIRIGVPSPNTRNF